MNENRDELHERRMAQGRRHLTLVALSLTKVLSPIDAAGLLMGAAVGILTEHVGDGAAEDYLRQLADELARDNAHREMIGHA